MNRPVRRTYDALAGRAPDEEVVTDVRDSVAPHMVISGKLAAEAAATFASDTPNQEEHAPGHKLAVHEGDDGTVKVFTHEAEEHPADQVVVKVQPK